MDKCRNGVLLLLVWALPALAAAAGDLDDMTMEILAPEQPAGNLLQLPGIQELQDIDQQLLQQPRESRDLGVEANALQERALDTAIDEFSAVDGAAPVDDVDMSIDDSARDAAENMDKLLDFFDAMPPLEPDKAEVMLGGV